MSLRVHPAEALATLGDLTPRSLDATSSLGEKMSSLLCVAAFVSSRAFRPCTSMLCDVMITDATLTDAPSRMPTSNT